MPIYMDRHDVSEMVTAEIVAELHQQDLKIQHKFNCKGLTYWFDDNRKTAFCLVDAPNKQSIIDMHNAAHGEVPHQIIEVDANIVESFLGRIEDPEQAQNSDINIINDPAFRIILLTGFNEILLDDATLISNNLDFHHFLHSFIEVIGSFKGRIVKQTQDRFLVSFESVSQAMWCALELHSRFNAWIETLEFKNINLKTGISAGVPVTEKMSFFEDAIKFAEQLFYISNGKIVVSTDIKELYKSENRNAFLDSDSVVSLTPSDERFLNLLLNYTEEAWQNTDLHVDDLGKNIGYSKSQLYRKMISLTGMSPNNFIKEYRLNRALDLVNKQLGNISEIAYETGFNSPSYFAKCFHKKYGLPPSEYQQLIAE